jgi:hypothetical protein
MCANRIEPYSVQPAEPDISFGPLTFYRKKCPDGIAPRIVDTDDGKMAIRLAVKTSAFPGHSMCLATT